MFDGCLVIEEIAYACTGVATALEATSLGVSSIYPQIFYLTLLFVLLLP